jgi:hypothetical protein
LAVEDAFRQKVIDIVKDEQLVNSSLVMGEKDNSVRSVRSPAKAENKEEKDFTPGKIDKSALTLGAPKRHRSKLHLRLVASQPCLVCGRQPCDAHHLRHAQPRGLGQKVSDEYTVPLCRVHHREIHNTNQEAEWWKKLKIDPLKIASDLWQRSAAGNQAP